MQSANYFVNNLVMSERSRDEAKQNNEFICNHFSKFPASAIQTMRRSAQCAKQLMS